MNPHIVSTVKKNSARKKNFEKFLRQFEFQSMVLPGILYFIIFSYLPMYGVIIAFKRFDLTTTFFTAPWVGFKYFIQFLTDPRFFEVMRNTLGINIFGLMIGFPVPIIFALLINELRNGELKRITQTVSYMPHFVSWVIYSGIVVNLLSLDSGAVNYILLKLKLVKEPVFFMGEPNYFWAIIIVVQILKELGWGAILYLAAIAGVDQELYEAAVIDGASRLQRVFYVTLPCISGTVVILLIFAVSRILNTGFDQIWVMQNSLNVSMSETIDTYVYKIGIQQFNLSYATAVGLSRSVIAVILLVSANFLSNKLTDKGLF